MPHAAVPSSPRVARRTFVGTAALAAAASVSPGGLFASGSDRIRVGLVGCGGRGTGAALHAAAVDPGVAITCMADPFADHVASSGLRLESLAGRQFDCPPGRRFVGLEAWREVVAADVDLVILATPPAFRPLQAAAAVGAGRHVYCERPAAIDPAGVRTVLAACADAERRGLAFASGLARRHDPATIAAVASIRRGAVGTPRHAVVHHRIGPAWHRPSAPGSTAAERRLRDWISSATLSGGDMVEHLVDAIDAAIWALGDDEPVAAAPMAGPVGAGTRATIVFADGRTIDAAVERGSHRRTRVVETVRGSTAARDLAAPAGLPPAHDPRLAAMADLVAAIRRGGTLAGGAGLCRSTLAAVMARMAAETGGPVRWGDLQAGAGGASRPLQSA